MGCRAWPRFPGWSESSEESSLDWPGEVTGVEGAETDWAGTGVEAGAAAWTWVGITVGAFAGEPLEALLDKAMPL